MAQPPADPLVGTTIAQYEILAKIGGGGMGIVYSARDTRLGRLVALKFLPPQWSHDDAAKQRFVREAQAASATDHPNICTIHDIATAPDGRLFLVMAHYEGQTLKQKLEGGRLEIEAAVEIAAQVAEGLAKAHAQGVVHRDIKPGNLMVCGDSVKILDFGLAKFATALQLTMEGSTLGTAAYMSPEQVRGEDIDARSDVWSLGVVLYEMLAGRPPFQGGYAEAIAYAIRNETPAPLRLIRPEVPEALEHIVFRALHKEASIRFQDARDFARALRTLQGRAIPEDLLSAPLRASAVRAPAASIPVAAKQRRHWAGRAAIAALVLAAIAAGAYPLLTRRSERVPIAIAPVINQTGYPELDPYRLALTDALVLELGDSANLRVLPHSRTLEIVRRFLTSGADPSSRDAVQALAMQSGARFVVVPTLLYENGMWRARAELQDSATATNASVLETAPVASSLAKDTAYALMANVASAVQGHFEGVAAPQAHMPRSAAARLRTLDAARSYEAGIDAVGRLEYAAARTAFADAVKADPRNPLAGAWLTRMLQTLRQGVAASEAAERTADVVSEATPATDAAFVGGVVAEARRDFAAAAARYRDLIAAQPDEPAWLLELAAFLERRGRIEESVAALQQALGVDSHLARPELDLCRLYNRLDDGARARQYAQRALEKYRALGDRGGEAQVLLCMTDTLRVGDAKDRAAAVGTAGDALRIFSELRYPYNVARAYHYVALTAQAQGNLTKAVSSWERSLESARAVGNPGLEAVVVMNLGVQSEALGNHTKALDYYRQSYTLNESLGDEREGARSRANAGALLIEYGLNPDEGLRDVQNALAVFQKVGDKSFEVLCLQLAAAYHRYAGQHAEAERELNQAIAVSNERGLPEKVPGLKIDLARSRFELADYARARTLLTEALNGASAAQAAEARIRLGMTSAALGDAGAAQTQLTAAASQVEALPGTFLVPLLNDARGQLAYESGRPTEARAFFERAAAGADVPEAAGVEARAYLGLLDAQAGEQTAAIRTLQEAVTQALTLRRVSLATRARIHLARGLLAAGRAADAVDALLPVSPDVEQMVGPELQSFVHYWRGEALAARRQDAAAGRERARARSLIDGVRQALPEADRARFIARPDIRPIITDAPQR